MINLNNFIFHSDYSLPYKISSGTLTVNSPWHQLSNNGTIPVFRIWSTNWIEMPTENYIVKFKFTNTDYPGMMYYPGFDGGDTGPKMVFLEQIGNKFRFNCYSILTGGDGTVRVIDVPASIFKIWYYVYKLD